MRSFGPFVSLERDLGDVLTATVGGRYDRYRFAVDDLSRDMDQFSPMVGRGVPSQIPSRVGTPMLPRPSRRLLPLSWETGLVARGASTQS